MSPKAWTGASGQVFLNMLSELSALLWILFFGGFKFIYVFYLWLWVFAALGGLSVVAENGDCSLVVVPRLLTVVASLVADHRLWARGLSSYGTGAC